MMKVLVRPMMGDDKDFEIFDKVRTIHTQAKDGIQWVGEGNSDIGDEIVDITITIHKEHHVVMESGGVLNIKDR